MAGRAAKTPPTLKSRGGKMTAAEFTAIWLRSGLSQDRFGRALGYQGEHVRKEIHEFCRGIKDIPERTARLAIMLDRHGIPADFVD